MSDLSKDIDQFINKFELGDEYKTVHLISTLGDRLKHIQEEVTELETAILFAHRTEIIDALVDITYLAIGTARMCGFDFNKHWDEVHKCNMAKELRVGENGYKIGVCKPIDWQGPDHQSIIEDTINEVYNNGNF